MLRFKLVFAIQNGKLFQFFLSFCQIKSLMIVCFELYIRAAMNIALIQHIVFSEWNCKKPDSPKLNICDTNIFWQKN